MGAPYTSVTVSGYNDNPPSDDGTQTPANKVNWSKHKTKIGDPLKTAIEAMDAGVVAGFGKIVGGAGVLSTAISYEVLAADQGKLIKVTGSGVTITTPSATVVGSPFVFAILNLSGGNITIDGNGSQTIDGAASITLEGTSTRPRGLFLFTDATNWFTAGQNWQFDAPDRPSQLFNGSWTVSVSSKALTIALKTRAGANASATDPVLCAFRSSTVTDGGINVREVTGALSLVISSGSTLGFAAAEANLLFIGLIDNDGTPEICASKNGALFNEDQLATTTTEGGGGGADSGTAIYSTTGRTSKPIRLLGAVLITTGAVAGEWDNAPTRVTTVTFNPLAPFKNTPKLHARANGAGTALSDGFNISSITDTGTGRIKFTSAVTLRNALFSAFGTAEEDSAVRCEIIDNTDPPTTTTVSLSCIASDNNESDPDFHNVSVLN